MSREGCRIVQERLTNAAKHARGEAVALRVAVCLADVRVELVNALPRRPVRGRRGRGLDGMRSGSQCWAAR
ncbi:MAG TPA: hypothetical protein VFM54_21385 [Micromonosporaceae bacterium]|nr:hypothetical protein [Micromonosporaceae bacterium]